MVSYAGLDVSLETVAVCVVDGDGAGLWRGKCVAEPEAIAVLLAHKAPGRRTGDPRDRRAVGLALPRAPAARRAGRVRRRAPCQGRADAAPEQDRRDRRPRAGGAGAGRLVQGGAAQERAGAAGGDPDRRPLAPDQDAGRPGQPDPWPAQPFGLRPGQVHGAVLAARSARDRRPRPAGGGDPAPAPALGRPAAADRGAAPAALDDRARGRRLPAAPGGARDRAGHGTRLPDRGRLAGSVPARPGGRGSGWGSRHGASSRVRPTGRDASPSAATHSCAAICSRRP